MMAQMMEVKKFVVDMRKKIVVLRLSDRKEMYAVLKKKAKGICKYSKYGIYRKMYCFMRLFGLRALAAVLYIRNRVVFKRRNKRLNTKLL